MAFGSGLNVLKVDFLVLRILDDLVEEEENAVEVRDGFKNFDDWLNPEFFVVGNSHINDNALILTVIMLHQVAHALENVVGIIEVSNILD